MRLRYGRCLILSATMLMLALTFPSEGTSLRAASGQTAPVKRQPEEKLKAVIEKLSAALNKRDLDGIRSQISPNRIFVEIADRAGAYLSSNQTLVVMETFFRTRSAVNSTFEFVNDDGQTGSATGSLTARKDGRIINYKLNFGFTKNDEGRWLLTRVAMK